MITVKMYEMFLECFDYQFPDENKVIEMFENQKLQDLVKQICPAKCSKTRQLIIIQNLTSEINEALKTIAKMREYLKIPSSENEMPKITYKIKFKIDELISLRRIKSILDKDSGFQDEDGKSMYFELPLTSLFHIYFKTLSTT